MSVKRVDNFQRSVASYQYSVLHVSSTILTVTYNWRSLVTKDVVTYYFYLHVPTFVMVKFWCC